MLGQSMESGFQCAACGEWNTTSVDESAGRHQHYVEDCQVCCKPNVLRVEYDTSSQQFFITAELECTEPWIYPKPQILKPNKDPRPHIMPDWNPQLKEDS